MRISDWSSDVCSSDLLANQPSGRAVIVHHAGWLGVYAHLLFQRAHRHAVADRETALRISQIFGTEEKADPLHPFRRVRHPGTHQMAYINGQIIPARRNETIDSGNAISAVRIEVGVAFTQRKADA